MRLVVVLFILSLFSGDLFAQNGLKEIEGSVTYLTTQNVYVKFLSARGIKMGDKIFIRKNELLIPVLSVENFSSVSCVGKAISSEKLKIGDKVIALVVLKDVQPESSASQIQTIPALQDSSAMGRSSLTQLTIGRKERIDGRIQISSYTNISSLSNSNSNLMRYVWSLNAANLSNSAVSFDSYISFSHNLNDWTPIQQNIFNGLKIYDLNLKFEVADHTKIWLGRKINPKISSIGAIDGLQVEMNLAHFFWGALAGFRPDYTNYSFNKDLLEYGAFLGHSLKNTNGVMQTTFAGFNQTNARKTDRRYLYVQHDNSLLKNLNLFFSSEFDLYKVVNSLPVNELSLTSLYLMLNFRISRKLSLSTSYDNRKNVIYFETYKNYVDLMLADATRQGVQFRINYRPIPFMSMGLSSSYWDRAGDAKPTKNFNGFLTYTQLPLWQMSASLTVNELQTSYISGSIYGLRLDKSLLKGKLNAGMNYRYVDYTYLTSSEKLLEHIFSTDLSMQFTRKFSLSVNYEGTFEKLSTYHQIYFSLIKRF